MKLFDPRWLLGVKGQGRTLETLKSDISETVRDREMLSIEVKLLLLLIIINQTFQHAP